MYPQANWVEGVPVVDIYGTHFDANGWHMELNTARRYGFSVTVIGNLTHEAECQWWLKTSPDGDWLWGGDIGVKKNNNTYENVLRSSSDVFFAGFYKNPPKPNPPDHWHDFVSGTSTIVDGDAEFTLNDAHGATIAVRIQEE